VETSQRKWKGREIQRYFKRRFSYDESSLKDLNWTALAMARKRMDPGEQIYATKLLTGWLATGTRKELYGDTRVGCHRW
jgi:hypothetical protein